MESVVLNSLNKDIESMSIKLDEVKDSLNKIRHEYSFLSPTSGGVASTRTSTAMSGSVQDLESFRNEKMKANSGGSVLLPKSKNSYCCKPISALSSNNGEMNCVGMNEMKQPLKRNQKEYSVPPSPVPTEASIRTNWTPVRGRIRDTSCCRNGNIKAISEGSVPILVNSKINRSKSKSLDASPKLESKYEMRRFIKNVPTSENSEEEERRHARTISRRDKSCGRFFTNQGCVGDYNAEDKVHNLDFLANVKPCQRNRSATRRNPITGEGLQDVALYPHNEKFLNCHNKGKFRKVESPKTVNSYQETRRNPITGEGIAEVTLIPAKGKRILRSGR